MQNKNMKGLTVNTMIGLIVRLNTIQEVLNLQS